MCSEDRQTADQMGLTQSQSKFGTAAGTAARRLKLSSGETRVQNIVTRTTFSPNNYNFSHCTLSSLRSLRPTVHICATSSIPEKPKQLSPKLLLDHPSTAIATHTMSSESLFSPDLISSEVAAALPEGYTIRPLQKSDYHAGFLDVLAVLTTVGDVSEQDFNERFQEMQASGALGKGAGGYHTLVILNGENKIVGTGALIVEKKL